ncbi:MAG: glycerol-3-phosphate dehydrogenase [Desulfuromonas sp.]|nr:MAG: glycerol-3-phosphate dehydrogenase [Desulfuromonas sp.]
MEQTSLNHQAKTYPAGYPRRSDQLKRLQAGQLFDLLVIGGGATGSGIALDAATRGLNVALVEQNDFAEGTSSRSTKLVHGGVRYLEAAVRRCDRDQYQLVREGLEERALLLKNAPHLANPIQLVTPLYGWLEVPYIFAGLKLYDLLSGKQRLGHSRLLSRTTALQRFPMLKEAGLKAGVLYHDGQFHDARMALALALTAARYGATIANHVAVTGLSKHKGKIDGATVADRLSGEQWSVQARGVINATGPFTDQIRRFDDPAVSAMIAPSTGIHIVLDGRFTPCDTGLMIPETDDGRILFVLPWEGHALVGTTDDPAEINEHPQATEQEIAYLLRHVSRYFNLQIDRQEIKAVWSGIRPLVRRQTGKETSQLTRDHQIEVSSSGLLTITGGKWTTYRLMAEETVNHALTCFGLAAPHPHCRTRNLPVLGGVDYCSAGAKILADRYRLADDIAAYLHRSYGDQAEQVAELSTAHRHARLMENHPMLVAETVYAVRYEMAERVMDVLARRTPLALLDQAAAREAAPKVLELMAGELGWDRQRREQERHNAELRLGEGL